MTAFSPDGTVQVDGATLSFTGCSDLVIVFSGGTNYVPDASIGFLDPLVEPATIALEKAAVRAGADALVRTHVADYREKYDRQKVDLGRSTDAQRAMDTWTRLRARAASPTPTRSWRRATSSSAATSPSPARATTCRSTCRACGCRTTTRTGTATTTPTSTSR